MAPKKELIMLGLETSCDDTAVAVVTSQKRILANAVYNQFKEHEVYGGVVPEIAARCHVEHLDRLVEAVLSEAGLTLKDLDAIAATSGPGLIGGLMVGAVTGKALSLALAKPFLAINHLEGHALSPRLVSDLDFPYLLLLISGGHCQLLSIDGRGAYRRLGTTIDDAAGEAFDKGAKLLGLGVPGGPNLEKAARGGNPEGFSFPRPLTGRKGCDFSFSGLKTALSRELEKIVVPGTRPTKKTIADLAASYQAAIADCLVARTANAMAMYRKRHGGDLRFVMAGGVAANAVIRGRMETLCRDRGFSFFAPPLWLCTDNAAMIAWAALEHFEAGRKDPLDSPVRARWPLDESAKPKVGHGKKGAKV